VEAARCLAETESRSVAATAEDAVAERSNSATARAGRKRFIHFTFGGQAVCMRPLALRPRLATGLPLSGGNFLGSSYAPLSGPFSNKWSIGHVGNALDASSTKDEGLL